MILSFKLFIIKYLSISDPWQDLSDDYGKNGFGRINMLKTTNPHLKVLLAIGGWNEGSPKYSKMAGNAGKRGRFVKSALEFVRYV